MIKKTSDQNNIIENQRNLNLSDNIFKKIL